MEKRSVTVAAVDWEEYERAARDAFSAANTTEELSDAHVAYLGRRAALPQARAEDDLGAPGAAAILFRLG